MTSATATLRRGHRIQPGFFILVAVIVGASVVVGFALGRNTSTDSNTVRGSGRAATETRDLPPFTSVDLAGSNLVSVRVGSPQGVTVRADDNLVRLVTTKVVDGRLVIDDRGSFATSTPMSVSVTVPRLDAVRLSGSGTVSVDGVRAQAFRVELPGSGIVRVAGTTDRLDVTLHGSGELLLGGLRSRAATATLEGSGTIQLSASDSLRAAISGSGTILYAGDPDTVSKNVTGSGTITAA